MNPAAGAEADRRWPGQSLHAGSVRSQRSCRLASAFILVPLVFLLLKLLLIDPQLTPLRQTQLQNGALNSVAHSTQIDFGDQVRLLGYRLTPDQSPSGETVRVDLYWRALTPLAKTYQTTVGIIDAQRRSVEPQDARSAARLSRLSGDARPGRPTLT